MAYRTFRNEKYYEAPNVDPFASTIGTINHMITERIRDKRLNLQAAQRFKLDKGKGYYATDEDMLNQQARAITTQAVVELRKTGQISADTALAMEDHKTLANRSKIDYDTANNIRKQIKENSVRDKYYLGDVDNQKLIGAEYDGDISGRNDRIQEVASQLGGIDTFNKSKFLADHIQRQKLNTIQNVTDKSGMKTTRMTSAIFMRPDGTPGVTDQHVIDYFNSDARVDQWYNQAVDKQLDDDVKRMRALGNDSRVSWMKDMDDKDVKEAIIRNPGLDLINGTPFAERKKEMAMSDLNAGQDINRKVAVDYSDQYGANGGKFNNTKIGYQPTNIQQAINVRTLNGAKNIGTVGADLTYIDKGGPIKFVTNTPIRANVGTGESERKASDNLEFNLTNYGLYVYNDKGELYAIGGDSLQDMKNAIDAIPDDYFDSNKPHPLNPSMSIGLNGYAINKSKLINQSLGKLSSLAEEYNKAVDAGDEVKAASLKSRMDQVEKVRSMVGNADVDDIQLLLNGKQLGINGVQNDYIIKASDQDFAKLKSITNGLDLRDETKWTEDMRELNDHYRARYTAARENLVKNPPKKVEKPAPKSELKSSYQTNEGKTYTLDDLRKMGYTDAQLKQAIKNGTIK